MILIKYVSGQIIMLLQIINNKNNVLYFHSTTILIYFNKITILYLTPNAVPKFYFRNVSIPTGLYISHRDL